LLLGLCGLGYVLNRYRPDLAAKDAMRTMREVGAGNIGGEAREPIRRNAWSLLRAARGSSGTDSSGNKPWSNQS
jgi:hypothetical protein